MSASKLYVVTLSPFPPDRLQNDPASIKQYQFLSILDSHSFNVKYRFGTNLFMATLMPDYNQAIETMRVLADHENQLRMGNSSPFDILDEALNLSFEKPVAKGWLLLMELSQSFIASAEVNVSIHQREMKTC